MRTKSSQFMMTSSLHENDIIALTETWLYTDIASSEYFDNFYNVYRCDRCPITTGRQRGGGVLLAVRTDISSKLIVLPVADLDVEQICVQVNFINKRSIYFIVSYIPPNSSLDLYEKHLKNINFIVENLNFDNEIVVLGDFNLGNILWILEEQNLLPFNIKSDIESNLLDFFLSNGFNQINSVLNDIGRVLDLIFITSELKAMCESSFSPMCSNSLHHKALLITLEFYCYDKKSPDVENVFNFAKADFTAINEWLQSIDWGILDSLSSPLECYDLMCERFTTAINHFVPLKPKILRNKPPWFDAKLCKLKNIKNKAFKIYKRTKNDSDRLYFENLRNEFDKLQNFLFKQYIFNTELKLKSNPSGFWQYVNSKRNTNGYPTSMEYGNLKANSTIECCNLFTSFFQEVYEQYATSEIDLNISDTNLLTLDTFEISEEDVALAISNLKPSFSTESDGFPKIFFIACLQSVVTPLTFLYNACLKVGSFLDCWKICSIVPIFKSGNRGDVKNYRAIVKQGTFAKIFDRILKEKLLCHIKSSLCDYQHGFLPGKSTCSNLALISNHIIKTIEQHNQLDVLYTDFSKAFDKVDHNILLYKLNKFGISNSLLEFFRSYLIDRKLYVKIGSIYSETVVTASSGIPQGTHCGPLLFLIFINDLPQNIKFAKCLMFADDVKLFLKVSNLSDCFNLQQDLKNFQTWCDSNNLHLNIGKCCVMSYSKSHSHIIYNYLLNDVTLTRKTEVKDLGIIFDIKMKFDKHHDYVVSKAYSRLGFIKRNSQKFKDPCTIKALYVALVRSILDYGCVIWNPFYNEQSDRIERIQRNITRFALYKLKWPELPSYVARRKLLGLQSLKDRRSHFALMFVFNIFSKKIVCVELLDLFELYVPVRNLRNNRVLVEATHRTNYACNEPIARCIHLYNSFSTLLSLNVTESRFRLNLFMLFN